MLICSRSYTVGDPSRGISRPADTQSTMDNGEEASDIEARNTTLPFNLEDPFTDVVLVAQGRELYTNRSLLAYASPVFSCMFTAEFRERNEKVINLPDKQYTAVSEMLSFLHPGVDFSLTNDIAFRLLPLADEYQVSVLKAACEECLLQDLRNQIFPTVDFILCCTECAEKCNLKALLESCINKLSDPDMPLKPVKENRDISLETKARIFEGRIDRLETEKLETEGWKHRVGLLKKRLKDIIIPHDEHCRCRTEIKLRNAVQRCCPYCTRSWCNDTVSTDSYRNSYWFYCNHKIGYHISHDATVRTFLEQEDR